MKKVFTWIGQLILTVAVSVAFAVFILEWMAGCGETYIAADGKRYANECLFIK